MGVGSNQLVEFFVLGLGTSGFLIFLALGIVLVYKGSGVVNFAAGGFGLVGATVYYELHDLHGWPLGVALVLGVGASAVLGAVTHLCIMRPMRRASGLARIMATLGILAVIQGLDQERNPSQLAEPVKPFLPTSQFTFAGANIEVGRLILFVIAVSLAVALWLVYRSTRFGLATTAVAENPRVTAALGWSPDLVATVNWAIGGALSGLAGVMIVPFIGLSGQGILLLVVPALAVALIGRFSSFLLVLLGGVILGVLGSEGLLFEAVGKIPTGSSNAIPLIVIIVMLTVRGRSLPIRGERSDRLPRVASGRIRPVLVIGAVGLAALSVNHFTLNWVASMTAFAGFGILCLSLVVVTGYCGQISLAQIAFAGVGALIAGRLVAAGGLPMPLAVLLGIVATIPIGLIVAFPAIRVRGVSLAIVTLSVSVVVYGAVLTNPHYTGGALTGTVIPKPSIAGYSLYSVTHPQRYAILGLIVLALVGVVVANIRRGRSGRRLLAVRSNERAAASLGVSVVGAKLYAFGVGAGLAATGGIYMAFQNQQIDFTQFQPFESINLLLYTVIGGVGSVVGAVLGAGSAQGTLGEQVISSFVSVQGWFPVVAGVVLIVIIITHADGLADVLIEQCRAGIRRARLLPGRLPGATRLRRLRRVTPRVLSSSQMAPQVVTPQSLAVDGVTIRFGGVVAVDGASFEIAPGEIMGLIGPNGAGKTTLIDIITGSVKPQAGHVSLGGTCVDAVGVTGRARGGISRSFQNLELFEDLTVEENLRVASEPYDVGSYFRDLVRPTKPALSDTALAAVREFQLGAVLGSLPGELSYAQRRLVAIARAVATSPSVLLLDEPAAGLDDASAEELSHLIRRLGRDWGMAVLLVEHHVGLVLKTCDRIVALNFGRVVACDVPEKIRVHPGVIESYLGVATSMPETAGVPAP